MTLPAPLWQRLLAEGLGVFALVTAGCGALAVETTTQALGAVGVSLVFGLVIFVMVASTGHVSGAHLNPAVTVAFAVHRHFPWREVGAYVLAQVIGAILGAVVLTGLFGDAIAAGVTRPAAGLVQSLGLEVLLTATLMFVITAVATDTRAVGELAALAIGATVGLGALWGGPVSGASMNPARSLGPALLAQDWTAHWLYWLGPLVGAFLGAGAYQLLHAPRAVTVPEREEPT